MLEALLFMLCYYTCNYTKWQWYKVKIQQQATFKGEGILMGIIDIPDRLPNL